MFRKLLTFVAAALGVGVVVAAAGDDEVVKVVRVVDGDTIVAAVDGEDKRIRLLNVDTPELAKGDQPGDCLAEEAKGYLDSILTPGQEIELEYDVERTDRYDRDLAGVFVDGQLVNAEIAREGFGVAVQFGSNGKFFPDVAAAEREAKRKSLGVHDLPPDCSVPAQVDTLTGQTAALLTVSIASMKEADLDLHIGKILPLLKEAKQLLSLAEDPSDFAEVAYSGYEQERKDLDKAIRNLERRHDKAQNRIDHLEKKAEEERRKEEERRAAEERQKEAVQAEQERQRETQRRAVDPVPVPRQQTSTPKPAPQPSPSQPRTTGGGYDGYTGCRAYGGNYIMNSTDEKGRPYAKIDCTTRAQIG